MEHQAVYYLFYLGGGSLLILVITGIFKFGAWYGSVNTDRDAFKKFMESIDAKLADINLKLTDIWKAMADPVAKGASPVTLTELGQKLSGKLGAAEWAQQHTAEAHAETVGKPPFDIQEFCEGYVQMDRLTPVMQEQVKQIAYESGLSPGQVIRVLVIELRDALLKSDHTMNLLDENKSG